MTMRWGLSQRTRRRGGTLSKNASPKRNQKKPCQERIVEENYREYFIRNGWMKKQTQTEWFLTETYARFEISCTVSTLVTLINLLFSSFAIPISSFNILPFLTSPGYFGSFIFPPFEVKQSRLSPQELLLNASFKVLIFFYSTLLHLIRLAINWIRQQFPWAWDW